MKSTLTNITEEGRDEEAEDRFQNGLCLMSIVFAHFGTLFIIISTGSNL